MYSSVRILCRRSASLIRSTRTSSAIASSSLRRFSACFASLVTRSSFLSLVSPSTSRADIVTEQAVDFGARGLGILNGVVQERRGDRRVVKLEVGENGRDLDRMREIRIAGCAPLLTVRLHRVDVGAIEQRLVRVRVVAAHPFDQVVLPHHRRLSRRRRLFDRCTAAATAGGRGARIGACFCMRGRSERVRAISGASAAAAKDTTSRYHVVSWRCKGFANWLIKGDGPAFETGPLRRINHKYQPIRRRLPAAPLAAPGPQGL